MKLLLKFIIFACALVDEVHSWSVIRPETKTSLKYSSYSKLLYKSEKATAFDYEVESSTTASDSATSIVWDNDGATEQIGDLMEISKSMPMKKQSPSTSSSPSVPNKLSSLGQSNNNHGWLWMSLYWSIGMIVGTSFGYLPTWKNTISNPFTSLEHMLATVGTLGIIPRFFSSTTNFGRKRSIISSSIMAVMNGICETMLYMAIYDLGAVWLNSILGGSPHPIISPLLGFLLFSLYSGPIHVLFWFQKAFPKHVKEDAPPFHIRGLPEILLMSISWMVLYTKKRDIGYICVLHGIFNFCGTYTMGLELPSIKLPSSYSRLKQDGRDGIKYEEEYEEHYVSVSQAIV